MKLPKRLQRLLVVGFALIVRATVGAEPPPAPAAFAPAALAASGDGSVLYVACAEAARVLEVDAVAGSVRRSIPVDDAPSGLALSGDGSTLFVTCAGPQSTVCQVELAKGRVVARIPAGHTAQSPVLAPDGKRLFVCNRFNNDVALLDLTTRRTVWRAAVPREPVFADLTHDSKRLLVANHIHAGRADVDVVAASVSVIDADAGRVCQEIPLPSGSTLVRGLKVSPDGRHAVVVHQLSRFHLPTTQLERGWVNTSAVTIVDLEGLRRVNTVLLDDIDAGAANPWGVAWMPDGSAFVVSHAGTHELSVVDFRGLMARLGRVESGEAARSADPAAATRTPADVPNDLSFLVGLRSRIRLPGADRGPRAVLVAGARLWTAAFFTDALVSFDVGAPVPGAARRVPLGAPAEMSIVRRGEMYFNDASLCFQGWQSCSSCHSHDARVDGLNWDNLNDGIGNPKSAKSLLRAFETPPAMWLGVRADAGVAVRAGIRNSLFTVQPPEVAAALDAYLKSLQPIPSPHRVRGKLGPSAERGRRLFLSDAVGCADCHKGPQYTDQRFHDVGTVGRFDQSTNRFDTPTLIEVWRSGPYLHDGRATSIREVLTTFNPGDHHGVTSHLKPEQVDDLAEFVLSL